MNKQQLLDSQKRTTARAPQSLLQNRILRLLQMNEAKTVSQLTQLLEGNRSSVNRAVLALEKQGLVRSENRQRFLTEEGQSEVERLQYQLTGEIQRTTELARAALARHDRVQQAVLESAAQMFRGYEKWNHVSGIANTAKIYGSSGLMGDILRNNGSMSSMGIASSIMNISKSSLLDVPKVGGALSIFNDIKPLSGALAVHTGIFGSLDQARISSIGHILSELKQFDAKLASSHFGALGLAGVAETLGRNQMALLGTNTRGVSAFLDSQRLAVGALREFNSSFASMGLTTSKWNAANLSIGHIVGDLSSIRTHLLHAPIASDSLNTFKPILRGVERIALRYDNYLHEAFEHSQDVSHPLWDVQLPVGAAEQYVASVRRTIVSDEDREERAPIAEVIIERRESWRDLDEFLGQVSPHLVLMWHGAWETLQSKSPDRIRQAAHSGREVLVQILHKFAPDEAFSAEELAQSPNSRPTRKMRFRKTLGSSSKTAPGLLDVMARAVDESYNQLSAVSHAHGDDLGGPEQEVIGLLEMLQGLLRFVLNNVLRND